MSRWSKTYWTDLGERVALTFIEALIPAYVAAQNVAHLDWINALEISGSAAGLSLLKGLAANLANPDSGPSLLPAPPAPEVTDDAGAAPDGGDTPDPAARADRAPAPRVGVPGLRPPINAPALLASRVLTGANVTPPASADELARLHGGWAMLGNNAAGDCVAVTWANFRRLLTAVLAGREVYPTQQQVWEVYRTQNPDFDPNGTSSTNGPGSPADGGMDIQTLLNHLVKVGGPDGVKALAFAKVDIGNLDELRAAAALFGLWLGVTVDAAQQQQFADGQPWDYVSGSPEDGGHSVLCGGETASALKIITWAQETELTAAFVAEQLQQAWLVIWPEHVGTKAFQQGVDLATLAADYKALTGRDFPVAPPAPAPQPAPGPGVDVAAALADLTAYASHRSCPKHVARSIAVVTAAVKP